MEESIFKSKFFLKLFCIPSIAWIIISLMAMIPDKTNPNPITWKELILADIIILTIWLIISTTVFYVYNILKKDIIHKDQNNNTIIEKTNISTFKKCRFSVIICIITFLIGIFLSYDSVGVPIKAKLTILLVSFFPFVLFLIIILIIYKFRKRKKVVFTFKILSIIITCLLLFYYFYALFFVLLEEATNPITNPKYYNHYVSSSRLKSVFPKKIPNDVKKIEFYYAPGILQGGTNYSLYYIDKNMTIDKFDKKYKEKAIWIGHKEEYIKEEGLLTGAFSYTPANYKNEDDYIIYLVESYCDDSGYCNHGNFLLAAYNEKTHEVIFKAKQW